MSVKERGLIENTLQWGRVLMNAETMMFTMAARLIDELQWGRVLMNAETPGLSAPVPAEF